MTFKPNAIMKRRQKTDDFVPERILDAAKVWIKREQGWDEEAIEAGAKYKLQLNSYVSRTSYYFKSYKEAQWTMVFSLVSLINNFASEKAYFKETERLLNLYIKDRETIYREGNLYLSAARCGIDDEFEACITELSPSSGKPQDIFSSFVQ